VPVRGQQWQRFCLILVYVDDLLIAGTTKAAARGGLRVGADVFNAVSSVPPPTSWDCIKSGKRRKRPC